MKNLYLTLFDVKEMDEHSMKNTNGGSFLLTLIIVGLIYGATELAASLFNKGVEEVMQ